MIGGLDPATRVEASTPHHRDARADRARRSWVSVAAIFIVGLGLAALILVVTRPKAFAPVGPSPTSDLDDSVRTPPYAPDTVPVVEEMPGPLATTTLPAVAASTDSTLPSSDAIGIPAPAFTPLLLAEPPDGYLLTTARYQPGDGGFGIARYARSDDATALQIVVRNQDHPFDGFVGRPEWQIGDHVFVDDNQAEGCLPDVCSIGTMWDDHTYASIMWVDRNGGNLVAGADRDALLALAPRLGESTQGWLPITDGIELETLSDGDEVLLLVPDSIVIDTAGAFPHGPPGGRSAVLRAPDGTMQVLWQSPTPPGASVEPAFGDRRTIGGIDWSGGASGQVTLYDAGLSCAQLRVGDGGAGSGNGLWRDQMIALLGAISDDDGTTVVGLPTGWSRVGGASGEPIYEVAFPLELVPDDGPALTVSLVFDQSPGTSGGAVPDTASPHIQPADFLGNDAWIATDPARPELVGIAWFDGTTSRYLTLTAPAGVDATTLVGALERELDGWATGTTSTWLQTVGASTPTQERPEITTDACDLRELLVLT
jgi:hypothetical protein